MRKPTKKDQAAGAARKREGQRQVAKADAAASEKRINALTQQQLKKLMKGAEREEASRRAEAEFSKISRMGLGVNKRGRK